VHRAWYDVTTVYGTKERFQFNKNRQVKALFTFTKYWSIGRKKYTRFFLETGWASTLSSSDKVTQLTGTRISEKSVNAINSGSQPGPVLATGFSFGLH
jgi:hypothetical protein